MTRPVPSLLMGQRGAGRQTLTDTFKMFFTSGTGGCALVKNCCKRSFTGNRSNEGKAHWLLWEKTDKK